MLTFSRREDAEVEVFDLNHTIHAIGKMLQRLLGDDVRLRTELEQRPCSIRADKGWISQVMMNLLVNSRDAMPAGGAITVRTRVVNVLESNLGLHPDSRPGLFVLLEVEDTGTGMDPEVQKHLFEPFFTTKKPGEGTGLGLATVYAIVRRCDGWITVSSEVGAGTRIGIHFPLYDLPERQAICADQMPVPAAHQETILLVEDQAEVREFVLESLQSNGYRVVAAAGGAEALRLVSEHEGQIGLLLTDVVMPEINGLDLAEQIRRVHPETKVLFMSGFSGNLLDKRAEGLAGAPYLRKPFALETLVRMVHEAIHGPIATS